jgi:hypothetical protein
MAEKRKSISKKVRFEVFKRDKFTCQYCGKSAPDVVLEVDHIKPVSKGGNNSMLNLVTACFECNRGKTNTELTDDTVVKKQAKQLEELAERREQLNMLLEWRAGLTDIEDDCVQAVIDIFLTRTDWGVSEHGKKAIKKWLKEFSLNEVLEATEISIDTYYAGTEESWDKAFNKVSGICYTRRKQANDNRYYYANYTIKSIRENNWYCDYEKVKLFIFENVFNDDDFEKVKCCLMASRNWTTFIENMQNTFNSKFLDRRFE